MKLVARAKNPGPCVLKECTTRGQLVFVGSGYKVRACCESHANEVEQLMLELKYQAENFGLNINNIIFKEHEK